MISKVNIWFLFAACAIGAFGVGGSMVSRYQVAIEKEAVLARITAINSRPSTMSTHVNQGVTQYTLCSGGGWCITDQVPPENFIAPAKPAGWSFPSN